MFKINDYVVYKKEVCKIVDIKKMNDREYYILIPINDNTLKNYVPKDSNLLRNLITKQELKNIIAEMKDITPIITNDKLMENEYRTLLKNGTHQDLIKIIKTTYLRNQNRLDQNKKISGTDDKYFNLAEKYLYTEFSVVLNKTLEETKEYIIKELTKN
jgi:CarD family transcriptional regulator